MSRNPTGSHEMTLALLGVDREGGSSREAALVHGVVTLLLEVEALRLLAIRSSPEEFARAYEESAERAHNSAGIKPGLEKLLDLYYTSSESGPRELLLLRRLGYSPAELRRFADVMESAAGLT